MAHFKCTEHSSLHKTQHSDIKSYVCHFKTLPFKITLHEFIGHYMCQLQNNCYRKCYHFNQEVNTKRPQVRRRGGGRVRMRGGGRVRGRAGRGGHGQRRQQLSNEIRATLVHHIINHGLTLTHFFSAIFFFSLLFCEHIFVHSNVNISAVQCTDLFGEKCTKELKKKKMFQQHVCICKYFYVCEQSEEFSIVWTMLVLWQSILKIGVLFIMPNSV